MTNPPPRPSSFLTRQSLGLSHKQLEVLETIREFPHGAKSSDVGKRLAMHVNTVRGHIDELVSRDLVRAQPVKGSGRGRPSILYFSRVPNPAKVSAEYIQLLRLLVDQLNETPERALELGRMWARAAYEHSDEDYVAELDALFRDLGFDPEQAIESDERISFQLRACPFVTDGPPPAFICALHAGFVAEVTNDAAKVTPFSSPGRCSVNLPQ